MFNNPFTYEVASQLFSYDAESGEIRWKQPQGKKMKPGQVAGWINERGRVVVRFERKGIFGHRLAWLLHFGKWPELHLDHINGNPADNRIANLREVTPRVNSQNLRVASKHNKTGLLGVCPTPCGRKFLSCIGVCGKSIHLGTFATAQEAHEAYVTAKRSMHEGCTL